MIEWDYDGRTYNHCINYLAKPVCINWIYEYHCAQGGIWPEAGGLNDQYEIDLIAFGIIGAAYREIENLKRDK